MINGCYFKLLVLEIVLGVFLHSKSYLIQASILDSLLFSFYILSLFYLIHIYCFKCHYRLMAHKAISLIAYEISQLECVTFIIKTPLHYRVCMHAYMFNQSVLSSSLQSHGL